MINHKAKIVFIHIPKCAGTSINKALDLKVHDGSGHAYAWEHAAYINQGYYSFTVIRNPWERIVSLYTYFKQMTPRHRWYIQNKVIADHTKNIDFETFCKEIPDMKRNACSGVHFVRLVDILNLPQDCKLNRIARFENLQNDFNSICTDIKIPQMILPELNASSHDHYHNVYNNRSRSYIEELYHEDIDEYGYKF